MSFAATSLRVAAPVLVWAVHFGLVYGLTAFACARAAPRTVPWTIGIATLVAAALVLLTIRRAWPQRAEFTAWLTGALAAAALVAIVWEALPALLVPACA